MIRSRLTVFVLIALSLTACAGVPRRQRWTRALIAAGAVVGVTGGLMTAGCVPDYRPGACSAGPRDNAVRVGLPVLVVGAALITTGLLVRPPSQRPRGPNVTRHALPSTSDSFGPPPLNGY